MYDAPPTVPDDMDPVEARKAINALLGACAGDDGHPLFCRGHAQHQDYCNYYGALHKVIAQAEADQQEAVALEALEAARAEVGDLSPAEALARGRALLASPGYVTGTMALEERAKLKKEIDACYLVGSQPETSTPDIEETDDEPGNLED